MTYTQLKTFAPNLLLVAVVIFVCQNKVGATDKQPSWQDQMNQFSTVVVDAFPFFYSKSEFRDTKNKEIILNHMAKLAELATKLPSHAGKDLIGAEPLIVSLQTEFSSQMKKAAQLYKENDIVSSQNLVHNSLNTCFACHSAHPVGAHFPTTNDEIMTMASPFTAGKAIAFGSLRQFKGSQDLISKRKFSSINRMDPSKDELTMLYLIVSLRTLKDFAGAKSFVERLKKSSPTGVTLNKWLHDVRAWEKLAAENDEKKFTSYLTERKATSDNKHSLFLVYLLDSTLIHNRLRNIQLTQTQKAEAYLQLAKAYESMEFPPFQALPTIYKRACVTADPTGPNSKSCKL